MVKLPILILGVPYGQVTILYDVKKLRDPIQAGYYKKI